MLNLFLNTLRLSYTLVKECGLKPIYENKMKGLEECLYWRVSDDEEGEGKRVNRTQLVLRLDQIQ
ncbi:hypothetical protein O9G_005734, partial [Rozella allomycis CSF55]